MHRLPGRRQRAAPVAAPAPLPPADRAPRALRAARGVRHHPAALRPDGAARAPPRGAEDERALAPADGHRRQHHRDRRSAGEGRPGRAPGRLRRPPRVSHPPYALGREELYRDGARARAMGGRAARRAVAQGARRAAQAARQAETARDGGGLMTPKHFRWRMEGDVGLVTLNRPERKNPLTFESYDELRNHFWQLGKSKDVKSVVITGAGGNFCSGGDVHEIIGPLTK